MKTLKEHNEQVGGRERADHARFPASGVLCDVCGTEMLFDTPAIMSSGAPASQRVTCPNCSNHGRKLV